MLLCLMISLAASNEWWNPSTVFDITTANMNTEIGSSKHVVLEFYSPYCHWCRMMFHEYEELRKHYNDPSSAWYREDVLIARTNANNDPSISQNYHIYAFPTIIFIPANGKSASATFSAPRVKHHFIQWIEAEIAAAAKREEEKKVEEIGKGNENRANEEEIQKENREKEVERLEDLGRNNDNTEEIRENHENAKENRDSIEKTEENTEKPRETAENTENNPNNVKNDEHTHENNLEDDTAHPEEDEIMKFEMIIEDVSSHNSEKWRGEFQNLQILLESLQKSQSSDLQDLLLSLSSLKSSHSDQVLQLFLQIDALQKRLESLDTNIINRNRIESTQTRFNPMHMLIFTTIGCILGFGLSLYLVKVRPAKDYNKV
jgi:thioredoxin-like negative regulator of GroEL